VLSSWDIISGDVKPPAGSKVLIYDEVAIIPRCKPAEVAANGFFCRNHDAPDAFLARH
jgi:hypothetical protein